MMEKEDKKRKCWICGKEHPNVYEAFGCVVSHSDEEVGEEISGAGKNNKYRTSKKSDTHFNPLFRNTGAIG